MRVYFFECVGRDAFQKLETLEQSLETAPFVHSLKLLKSSQQPDLYLLVVEASEEAHIDAPENTRVWTFVEVES
jgi:hypothetical protein